MKHTLQSVLSHTPDLFSYTLLAYLVLFLLENVFPGFVSNTFDPNLLLIPVVILGIASAFAPEKKKKNEPPTLKDLITVVIMTVLSGVIIYYKTKELGATALVISIVGALLVLLVATALLFAPEEKEKAEPKHKTKKSTKTTWSGRWRIALIGVSLAGLTLGFSGVQYLKSQEKQTSQLTNSATRLTVAPLEEEKLTKPEKTILDQAPLTLINGGLGDEKIKTLASELTAYTVTIQKTGEADRLDYTGGTLYFRPEDAAVADYLATILKPLYPSLIRLPLPPAATGIILVAGKPEESP